MNCFQEGRRHWLWRAVDAKGDVLDINNLTKPAAAFTGLVPDPNLTGSDHRGRIGFDEVLAQAS